MFLLLLYIVLMHILSPFACPQCSLHQRPSVLPGLCLLVVSRKLLAWPYSKLMLVYVDTRSCVWTSPVSARHSSGRGGVNVVLRAHPCVCRRFTHTFTSFFWLACRLNTEGDYFSMTGSLMDPSTGCLPPQMEIQATCAPIITMPLATPPQADSATVGAVFASFTPKDRSRQDGSSGATAGCVELPNHGGGGSNPGAPVVSGRLFEPGPRNAMGSPCRGGGSGNAKAAGALDQRKRRSGEEEDGTERKKRKKQKLEAGVRGEASARDSLEGAVGGGGAMAEDALEGAGLKNSNKRSGKTSGAEGKTQQASVDRTNNVSRVVPQSSEVAADATPDLPERDRKGFASHAAGTGEARPSSLESGGWHGAATQSASWDSAHRKHKKKRTHDAGLSRGEGSKLGKAKGVGQRVDAGLLGELNHRQSGERKRKSKGN